MSACASQSPAAKADRRATELGFVRGSIDGGVFQHVTYRKAPAVSVDVLHIYIEGDGLPFIDQTTVSRDPTPDTLVMLELMTIDSASSVYLGRPCYFGLSDDPPCSAFFWTNGRYADVVVTGMVSAIQQIRAEYGDPSTLRLFGHSGGGSIALLIAGRVEDVETVVTIGANLDIDAWTDYHQYTRLDGSLNPVDRVIRGDLRAIHLVGADDETTPPALVLGAAGGMSHDARIIPGNGHTCCWEQSWADILSEIAEAPTGTASGSEGRK